MAYSNYIIDFCSEPITPIVEPVTLAEAKLYCRITTTSEDALINIMISAARETIEVATGLSLVSKCITTHFNNADGQFELPFGPVDNDSIEIYKGQDQLFDFNIVGGNFPKLTMPKDKTLKASYQAGYSTIPTDLKIAILDQISYNYENRGLDGGSGICQKSWKACQRWTRISPIL